MFGIWRTLLALEVVATHLIAVKVFGPFAVISFFVLSGFLMTMIMHQTYGYTPRGLAGYGANRALRLLPAHWFACLVALILIVALPAGFAQTYHPAMTMPRTAVEWLQNLTLIYPSIYPQDVFPRLSPPTWALTVEIFYYVLIGLGISRTRKSTLVWCAASLAYVIAAIVTDAGKDSVYGSLMGGSFAFSVGSLIYHYREELDRLIGRGALVLPVLVGARWAIIVGLLVVLVVAGLDWRLRAAFNVVNVLLSAAIVIRLFNFRLGGRWKSIDKRIGDFSYPIYLLHWPAGLLGAYLVLGEPINGASIASFKAFFLGALPILLIMCLVVVFALDPWVEAIRNRVRARSRAKLAEQPASADSGGTVAL